MNINKYPEIKPGHQYAKQFYIAIMMWSIGRAMQVAYKLDKNVRAEIDSLPANFLANYCLLPQDAFPLFFYAKIMPKVIVERGYLPMGCRMLLGKDKDGKLRYFGADTRGKKVTLTAGLKSIDEAFRVFSFRESLSWAFTHGIFVVDGDLPQVLAFVRALELTLVIMLPKFLAKLFLKRFPTRKEMPLMKRLVNRVLLWILLYVY